jgi:hypothetical protein
MTSVSHPLWVLGDETLEVAGCSPATVRLQRFRLCSANSTGLREQHQLQIGRCGQADVPIAALPDVSSDPAGRGQLLLTVRNVVPGMGRISPRITASVRPVRRPIPHGDEVRRGFSDRLRPCRGRRLQPRHPGRLVHLRALKGASAATHAVRGRRLSKPGGKVRLVGCVLSWLPDHAPNTEAEAAEHTYSPVTSGSLTTLGDQADLNLPAHRRFVASRT